MLGQFFQRPQLMLDSLLPIEVTFSLRELLERHRHVVACINRVNSSRKRKA